MRITLSGNLSYCFGVRKTLTLVVDLQARNPDRTYYMYGEIVHNELVIRDLRSKGLSIIRELTQIGPTGSVIIPSHGAPLRVFEDLQARGVDVIDATCPMVRLIHDKARRLEAGGAAVLADGVAQAAEVFFDGLRGVRETAGGVVVEVDRLAAERIEQELRGDAAGAID